MSVCRSTLCNRLGLLGRWKNAGDISYLRVRLGGNFAGYFSSTNLGDSKGTLVYSSPSSSAVLYAKTFSLFSSATVLLFQPFVAFKLHDPGLLFAAVACGVGFAVTTPLLLHLITRSHVSDLYFNHSTGVFTAYTRGVFLNKKKIEFTPEDVKCVEGTISMANLTVKDIPLFISETEFSDIDVYRKLMGFDKPLKLL